jgi:hypothetical protein
MLNVFIFAPFCFSQSLCSVFVFHIQLMNVVRSSLANGCINMESLSNILETISINPWRWKWRVPKEGTLFAYWHSQYLEKTSLHTVTMKASNNISCIFSLHIREVEIHSFSRCNGSKLLQELWREDPNILNRLFEFHVVYFYWKYWHYP